MVDINLPHRRQNPLTGDWILVSPHRNKRPWKGALETATATKPLSYDPSCYLCPGNERANGEKNPRYRGTFVFTNDHAALLPGVGAAHADEHGIFISAQESGTSRVICYSPDHAKTLAECSVTEIIHVIETWKQEYETLGNNPDVGHVQIFENKGPMMGASSPHPHCQIWVNHSLPTIPQKELDHQTAYLKKHGQRLLEVYLADELEKTVRIVMQNHAFAVVVPFWATWPYETMVLPKKHRASLSDFTQEDIQDLAAILKAITQTYDRVFDVSFPYSMGLHQPPTDGTKHDEWQFHIHFFPPLLRSATIKKHYVGYEMMAEGQRDMTPEQAAKTLQEHYAP